MWFISFEVCCCKGDPKQLLMNNCGVKNDWKKLWGHEIDYHKFSEAWLAVMCLEDHWVLNMIEHHSIFQPQFVLKIYVYGIHNVPVRTRICMFCLLLVIGHICKYLQLQCKCIITICSLEGYQLKINFRKQHWWCCSEIVSCVIYYGKTCQLHTLLTNLILSAVVVAIVIIIIDYWMIYLLP